MQAVAEGEGDNAAYNNKRYRRQMEMEVEEGVPDKGSDEVDRVADLTQHGKGPVGKAFKAKGGLIESKTDEDGGGGEDNPGYAGDNIHCCGVKEQEHQAYDQAQGTDDWGY